MAGITIGAVFEYDFLERDRFAAGIELAEADLSYQTRAEGKLYLDSKARELEKNGITLWIDDQEIKVNGADWGLVYHLDDTLRKALAYGAHPNFWHRQKEKIGVLVGLYRPRVIYQLDRTLYDQWYDQYIPPHLNETTIPRDYLWGMINQAIAEISTDPITVRTGALYAPRIRIAPNTSLLDRTELKGVTLTYEEQSWSVSAQTIDSYAKVEAVEPSLVWGDVGNRDFFEVLEKMARGATVDLSANFLPAAVALRLEGEKLDKLLNLIKTEIYQDPIAARYRPDFGVNNQIIAVRQSQPAKSGLTLDRDHTVSRLVEAVRQGRATVAVATQAVPPAQLDTGPWQSGIVEEIGKSDLPLLSSPVNRRYNVEVGAAKISGVVLQPQEEFSFLDTLGEVTVESGFRSELVIKDNKLISEIGGGLCHISSALFRAVTAAGLDITERHNHSFHVPYYGSTPGYDATIYPPGVDFKFKNNYSTPILIVGEVIEDTMKFDIYGKADHRVVEIDGPHPYDWQEDGSVKATLAYTVRRGDEILAEEIFYSVYKSPAEFPRE